MDNRFLSRGKRVDNGEWVVGWFSYDGAGIPGIGQTNGLDMWEADYEIDPATLDQCTGLEDKNGKPIFEGDIFKDLRGRICVVEWDAENARFLGVRKVGNDRLIAYVGQEPSVEVVGSIHDTPGELGGEKGEAE